MKEYLIEQLKQSLNKAIEKKNLIIPSQNDTTTNPLSSGPHIYGDPPVDFFMKEISPSIAVEIPNNPEHGDFSSNIAMLLAKTLRKSPLFIAQQILENFEDPKKYIVKKSAVAPGFINFSIDTNYFFRELSFVYDQKENFGRSQIGCNKKILIEFVSANPTGPLHVGTARGAVVGDVMARLLDFVGYDVSKEYYINDAGNQVYLLGESVFTRYLIQCGKNTSIKEEHYQGEYVVDLAGEFFRLYHDRYAESHFDEISSVFISFALDRIITQIKNTLQSFDIIFDRFQSEKEIIQAGLIQQKLDIIKKHEFLYEQDGKTWFKSTSFGDDKDRVVIRDTQGPTYFASDIAYHAQKLDRGFDTLVNVWGADHAGYEKRLQSALSALGYPKDVLHIIFVQMVHLLREGKPVKLGKRSGNLILIEDLLKEIGKDAARFFFIMRKTDAQLEFDLHLAKAETMDNPVFYVQYGHARMASILRKAKEQGYNEILPFEGFQNFLILPEESILAKKILEFSSAIEQSALQYEPHRMVYYLQDIIKTFHSYYTLYKNTEKIVTSDVDKTKARLFLCWCVKQVIHNGLGILGIEPKESMYLSTAE